MSRKRSKLTKNQIKYIVIGLAATVIVVVGILLAIFLPTIKANSGLNDIFDDLRAMNEPVIIVTDMKADSNFSDARGEIKIEDASSTKLIISDILSLKLDYDGKDTSDAWDIRAKISDGEKSAELYFAYGKMYYVENGVKYIFVPSEESSEALKVLYKTFSAFVK